jgi:hypothetical protein
MERFAAIPEPRRPPTGEEMTERERDVLLAVA